MNLIQLTNVCVHFAKMGGAVQEQFEKILMDPEYVDRANGNAVRIMRDEFLQAVLDLANNYQDDELRKEVEELFALFVESGIV
jgi:hypothetical protein